MKKTLLLSLAATSMIMANEASTWEFGGTSTIMYQTNDGERLSGAGEGDLFSQDSSAADAGVQLRAANENVGYGVGLGVEVSALATLGLQNSVVSGVMEEVNGGLTGGWLSQAYLTYGMGNTSIKAGRQELPESVSPMAYSEKWNIFPNTFDSVVVANTDLANTLLVAAYVERGNTVGQGSDIAKFNDIGSDGAWMLAVQNKSIEEMVLKGVYYNLPNTAQVLFGEVEVDSAGYKIDAQAGGFYPETGTDGSAFGLRAATEIDGAQVKIAYTTTSDASFENLGGKTSALYTDTVLDQVEGVDGDENKFLLSGSADVSFGGNLTATYALADSDTKGKTHELDLIYSTELTKDFTVGGAYVYANKESVDINLIRVLGKYNF
jgi:hypothetical protein